MTTQYSRSVLKLVVAQICQTIGWHSINSTPLEFMVDLLQDYIFQLSKLTQQYAQVLGRSEANLDDLGLAFQHLNIDLQELAEYVKNVDSVPCVITVPKLPVRRENHLNFLKPGSREVVTRPVHVHEHLPAMYPNTEEEYQQESKTEEIVNAATVSDPSNTSGEDVNEINDVVTTNGVPADESANKAAVQVVFKRPGDPVSFDGSVSKKPKTTENGRPLREIHSVIMTTSGFLSTAREGKLPEARTPQKARSESPPPVTPSSPPPPSPLPAPPPPPPPPVSTAHPMVPPEVKLEKKLKKIPKKSEDGKPENKENKKKKIPKDILFEPDQVRDVKVKKSVGGKDKLKALKLSSKAVNPNLAGPSNFIPTAKIPGSSPKQPKNPANKVKTEDVLPNSGVPPVLSEIKEEPPVDKLPVEPNKQKLNIFKKISSKPKEDKDKELPDPQLKLKNSQENSPIVIVDDIVIKNEDKKSILHSQSVNNNIVRVEDNVTNMMSPSSDAYMFDDMSPPRTPSTPKTPEINVPNVELQKKKKKDKTGKKKEPKLKIPKNIISPKKARLSNDSTGDPGIMERPKTPQGPEQPAFRDQSLQPQIPYPFLPFATAPGLIPHPIFPYAGMPKGIPGMMGAPNAAVMQPLMRPRFFRPKLDPVRPMGPMVPMGPIGPMGPMGPSSFVNDGLPLSSPVFPLKQQPQQMPLPLDKPRPMVCPDKEPAMQPVPSIPPEALIPPAPILNSAAAVPAPLVPPTLAAVVPAPLLPPNLSMAKPVKPDKPDKSEKKLKEHKKEKKDKLKKKKEKKEKHKDKGEKVKEKKDKSEKKDKLEKIKAKKEKKEKRKEKEANALKMKEEKLGEQVPNVPKITLKLGPAGDSPRPSTPDSALMKKITIKPPKKPEEEQDREPTPELARISALITRPPKQKSTSKRSEEGHSVAYASGGAGLPSDTPSSYTTNDSRAKKPIFKPLPQRELSPFQSFIPETYDPYANSLPEKKEYVYKDPSGRTIWICPACAKQDDGSPMIGCDDCDAWYHWVCVGIQVAPADDENWYCRLCIAKKEEQYHDKKKKKRKKKQA